MSILNGLQMPIFKWGIRSVCVFKSHPVFWSILCNIRPWRFSGIDSWSGTLCFFFERGWKLHYFSLFAVHPLSFSHWVSFNVHVPPASACHLYLHFTIPFSYFVSFPSQPFLKGRGLLLPFCRSSAPLLKKLCIYCLSNHPISHQIYSRKFK